jgi:hypothetical protein
MFRRLLVLSAAFALFSSTAQAATYYVSSSGSDSNPGTSPTAAWQTVRRVNNAALAPGDTVLFEASSTFGDTTLVPPTSGAAGLPITFGSFGTGLAHLASSNGAVWIPDGRHDLVFDALDLSSTGSGVFSDAAGGSAGVDNIALKNSRIHDTPNAGLQANKSLDDGWMVQNNLFEHIGDSAIILRATGMQITGNIIRNTGENPNITYGKHGVYDKGPNTVIADNDFSHNTNGQEISIRFHGAEVYGNTLHDTGAAIAFFADDPAAGVIRIYDNRAWNISNYAFYYGGDELSSSASRVGVVLASNTFQLAAASEAVNVSEMASATATIANNVFTGSYGSALRTGSGGFSEHNNDWFGGGWNVPSGPGDLHVDPGLSAPPALAPSGSSAVNDQGSMGSSGVTYTAACDGQPLHYCGTAPEMGGVEFFSAPAPVDVEPPSQPTGLAVTTATATSLALAWNASTDNVGVAGYDVFLNGAKVATATSLTATVRGLRCRTSYTVGVQAFDSAGNRSALATATGSTARCRKRKPERHTRTSSWRSSVRSALTAQFLPRLAVLRHERRHG